MPAMVDGIGSSFTPEIGGRREIGTRAPISRARDDAGSNGSVGAGEIGRFGAFGSLYEARGRQWAEAVQVRQLDRRLAKLDERIGTLHEELDQVKLYPPYPADEPRRAAAIRQFNGVAAEVARLVPEEQLRRLGDAASTADATGALERLQRVRQVLEQRRAELSVRISGTDGGWSEADAELGSQGVKAGLEQTDEGGIALGASDLLRQIS